MTRTSQSLRITIFVSSLKAGGAERVAVRLSGWLRDAGHQVCLLTLSNAESDFYKCPDGVERKALDLLFPSSGPINALWNNLRRMFAVRAAIVSRRTEVAISLGDRSNILMLLALTQVQCRRIISERTDPIREPVSRWWALLRIVRYRTATLHVSQSKYVSEWLKRRLPTLPCVVIGNAADELPAEAGLFRRTEGKSTDPLHIIAIGRLTRQKGFDLLLSAFYQARILSSVSIRMTIVGEGDERENLQKQLDALGISGSVHLIGNTADVPQMLHSADIFVLSSIWEGFPNVMIEAMVIGLPIIASRCQGGVEEILGEEPGVFALEFAAGDIDGLARAIVRLAESAALREQLRKAARKRASDYSPKRVAEAWCYAVEII